MKMRRVTFALTSIAFVGLAITSGCILDPEEEFNPPEKDKIDWKPLTVKENTIHNLQLAYDNYNSPEAAQKYEELLHSEYIWYMQEEGEYLLREDDVTATRRIFENAIVLDLDLRDGVWYPVAEHGGNPCEDCWETSREYEIVAQFDPTGKTYAGHDLVTFLIKPEGTGSDKKYKVYLAWDVNSF